MKQVAVMAVVALLGLSLVGCGPDTPESVMGEMIGTMKDLNGELAKIKTADDLKAAEGKLKQLGERMKDIKERGDKLGMDDLPKEKQEALEAKFKGDTETLRKDMRGNIRRLAELAATDPEAKMVFDSLDLGPPADTPESVIGEMIGTMKDLNGELAKIKTADDLKAAEGKLKQLGERMKDIKERGDKLGMENLPKEQQEALEAKFKGTMETVMKDMMGNMMRLGMLAQSDPEAKKVFDSFGDIMK